MREDICRAITFINYHIPIVKADDMELQYATVGFFDGMFTERLSASMGYNLNELWNYGLKRTVESVGQYSYQNIYCFSRDEWNECSDETFWKDETDEKYPLTFVVFIQLRKYMVGKEGLIRQCRNFNEVLEKNLGDRGLYYSYCTIDKNDFVICLKCVRYEDAVKSIKELHAAGVEVVYSYSVFSMSYKILNNLTPNSYEAIFEQRIDSICLKGITNSFDPYQKVSLDKKYYEFCEALMSRLYKGMEEKEKDYRIYDILGDDDFRLIARNVNLGVLLQQFAKGGMLCYSEKQFRFYLFSSNLVLNTKTPIFSEGIEPEKIQRYCDDMDRKFISPLCDQLQRKMAEMMAGQQTVFFMNQKMISFCRAIWQLIQSLKALEMAPTKKYDFWSLYEPLSLMIEILEEKIKELKTSSEIEDLSENEEIYDFIHKISMTLHGTLRTDIQFFQIRDFNVIVHYAPAKLRAFYSLWALKLSIYYNNFCDKKNQYSFVFSPGMFGQTGVKQLFTKYNETKRLMLITVPESQLYSPQWLSVILAHEVSHFVGYTVRNRETRHRIWLEICARCLFLEISYYRYGIVKRESKDFFEQGAKDESLLDELSSWLREENKIIIEEEKKWPHTYHSKNSISIILKNFRNVSRKYLEKIVMNECERMNNFLVKEQNINTLLFAEKTEALKELRGVSFDIENQICVFCQKFQYNFLPQLLKILKYITSEAYADLVAILTLDLTPSEHLFAFTKGEFDFSSTGKELEDVLLIVRIGLTICSIESTLTNMPSLCKNEKFVEEWTGGVVKKLATSFKIDSAEGILALGVYGYVTGIRKANKSIRHYKSIYNFENGAEDFINKKLDFFNDKVIWELLLEYMSSCTKSYLYILNSSEELQASKRELQEVHRCVTTGTAVEIAQVIENFLAKYEGEEE